MAKRGRPPAIQRQNRENERIDRALKALELKRNFDLTYEQIGRQLSISSSTAYEDVMFLLRKKINDNAESVEEMRTLMNERVGLLWQRWLPKALGSRSENVEPDLNAARFCENLIKRWCEINGLNAPINVNLSGKIDLTKKEEYHFTVNTTKKLSPAERRKLFEAFECVDGDGTYPGVE